MNVIPEMKPRRFFRNVLIPAFIPLILVAAGQTLSLSPSFNLIFIALLLAASGLYLKRLNEFWGYAGDIAAEIRRFRLLIWLIPILSPISLGFLGSIAVIPETGLLLWIYLFVGGTSLFILLTLFLQLFRFSPEISTRSFRVIAGLVIAAALTFTGWAGGLQFLIFFLLAVWIFKFEACDQIPKRRKIVLALICLLGLIFLAAVGGREGGTSLGGSKLIFGDVTIGTKLIGSVRILEARLFPFLPVLVAGLKRMVLAIFIVLPVKLLLRPTADWLKFRLRIRTKLLLAYFFSSIIPVFLLVLILLFGVFFILGGYWQLFVTRLIESRAETMQVLWDSGTLWLQQDPAESRAVWERRISDQLQTEGISAVVFELIGDNRLSRKCNIGEAFQFELEADSLVLQLGKDAFAGLAWMEDSLFLSQWMKSDEEIIALFRPFTLVDLNEIKARCGNDLVVYPAARASFTDESFNLQVGQDGFKAVLATQESSPGGILNRAFIAFPVLSPGLIWSPKDGLKKTHSFMTVKASISSLFGILLSTEQVINRIYLAIFIFLAAFFGAILVLMALVGFGLAGGITRTIKKVRQGTQQLRRGDLSASIEVKSKDELGELAESFNLMVADLNRMLEEVKEKERLEGELEAAKAIQIKLLPEQVPQVPGFEIAATSLPAKQVGGDYYDFLTLPGGQLGLALGDVSGKGMPAALLMANLQASLRTLAEANLPPGELIEKLNIVLHGNTAPQMFATFFYASLDVGNGSLCYVNAGHNYPILCGNGRMEQLSDGGLLLGVVPEGKYQEGRVTLEPGEIIAIYSDGITEASIGDDEEFGEERLIRLLQSHSDKGADTILRTVLEEVEAFCGTPQDDVTLMVVKRV